MGEDGGIYMSKQGQLTYRIISELLTTVHGNRGRIAWNRKSEEMKTEVMKLVESKYFDFNMTHCLEKLKEDHGLEIKYPTFRRWCHEKKLVKRAKRRRPVARYRRARMQSEGLLLQMDGSPHRYNGKDEWCLIAAIDDATKVKGPDWYGLTLGNRRTVFTLEIG